MESVIDVGKFELERGPARHHEETEKPVPGIIPGSGLSLCPQIRRTDGSNIRRGGVAVCFGGLRFEKYQPHAMQSLKVFQDKARQRVVPDPLRTNGQSTERAR